MTTHVPTPPVPNEPSHVNPATATAESRAQPGADARPEAYPGAVRYFLHALHFGRVRVSAKHVAQPDRRAKAEATDEAAAHAGNSDGRAAQGADIPSDGAIAAVIANEAVERADIQRIAAETLMVSVLAMQDAKLQAVRAHYARVAAHNLAAAAFDPAYGLLHWGTGLQGLVERLVGPEQPLASGSPRALPRTAPPSPLPSAPRHLE